MIRRTYLDYAAITPLAPEVAAAVADAQQSAWANPGSPTAEGIAARDASREAVARIAAVLGARPTEIVMTSGSTEGLNMAIRGVMARHAGAGIVLSHLEHEAVATTAQSAVGDQAVFVPVGKTGVVDPDTMIAAINDQTVIVCLQYVNNELGTIQPLRQVAAGIEKIRAERIQRGVELPLYLLCDAAQAGWQSLAVTKLGVDLLTLGGSKLYGPRGVGVLYRSEHVGLDPIVTGGGQQRGYRSGTENVAGAIGMAVALERMQAERKQQADRLLALRDQLEKGAVAAIPDCAVNAKGGQRAAHISSLLLPGVDGETLVAYLDDAGFAVATGSACNAANEDPSTVLQAIGLTRDEAAASLRISIGRDTTAQDIQRLLDVLPGVARRVRALGLGS